MASCAISPNRSQGQIHLDLDEILSSIQSLRGFLGRTAAYLPQEEQANLVEAFKDVEYLATAAQLGFQKSMTNSSNSSVPPSQDPHRKNRGRRNKGSQEEVTSKDQKGKGADPKPEAKPVRKPGGQKGHPGHHMPHVENPDEIVTLPLKEEDLPAGHSYTKLKEYEVRQVHGIKVRPYVTEFRAEVWVDENGKRYVAGFPKEAKGYAQYSPDFKALAIYLKTFQLLPYQRLAMFYQDLIGIKISQASIRNFCADMYEFLSKTFKPWVKSQLLKCPVVFFDETPTNIAGKMNYTFTACTDKLVCLECYESRGADSIREMNILPNYNGIAMTDCYPAYFMFNKCLHALCGAHLQRDLKGVEEKEGMKWATNMKLFFKNLNEKVKNSNGVLGEDKFKKELKHFNNLITRGLNEVEDRKESLSLSESCIRITSKSEALLKRLINKGKSYFVFARNESTPFDNNIAERSFRMLKVLLKISGCFKSLLNANHHCLIRSYFLTCAAHGVGVYEALKLASEKKLPSFINLNAINKELYENNTKKILVNNESKTDNNECSIKEIHIDNQEINIDNNVYKEYNKDNNYKNNTLNTNHQIIIDKGDAYKEISNGGDDLTNRIIYNEDAEYNSHLNDNINHINLKNNPITYIIQFLIIFFVLFIT